MLIWFASGNIHKKEELSDILYSAIQQDVTLKSPNVLNGTVFELKMPQEAGLAFEPDEKGTSFLENALIKAEKLYQLLEESYPKGAGQGDWRTVIAEDSGLCVDALGGRPGIHSARYGGENLGAGEKNALLLKELGDNPQRNARFVCAMVLYFSPNRFYIAQEHVEGQLVKNIESAEGKGGFGYDPIFYIPELCHTMAELSAEEKNHLSHRGKAGRAIAKMLAGINSQGSRK